MYADWWNRDEEMWWLVHSSDLWAVGRGVWSCAPCRGIIWPHPRAKGTQHWPWVGGCTSEQSKEGEERVLFNSSLWTVFPLTIAFQAIFPHGRSSTRISIFPLIPKGITHTQSCNQMCFFTERQNQLETKRDQLCVCACMRPETSSKASEEFWGKSQELRGIWTAQGDSPAKRTTKFCHLPQMPSSTQHTCPTADKLSAFGSISTNHLQW